VEDVTTPGLSPFVYSTEVKTSYGSLRGFRLAKAGRSPVVKITAAFQNEFIGDRINNPGGSGYGNGSFTSGAFVNLFSVLGDTRAVTLGLYLSQTNQAVVYAQPYADRTRVFLRRDHQSRQKLGFGIAGPRLLRWAWG